MTDTENYTPYEFLPSTDEDDLPYAGYEFIPSTDEDDLPYQGYTFGEYDD